MNESQKQGSSGEQELIDFYQSQQLSSERFDAMLDDAHAASRKFTLALAIAASMVFMTFGVVMYQHLLVSQRTDVVLREAALNHISKLKMDAEAGSLAEIQSELSELGFEITLPEGEIFQQLAVKGGRYCTINGNLAAHLKLEGSNESDKYSLFLTPHAENLKSLDNAVTEVSGVDVELWHEDNVVFALVTGDSQ